MGMGDVAGGSTGRAEAGGIEGQGIVLVSW